MRSELGSTAGVLQATVSQDDGPDPVSDRQTPPPRQRSRSRVTLSIVLLRGIDPCGKLALGTKNPTKHLVGAQMKEPWHGYPIAPIGENAYVE